MKVEKNQSLSEVPANESIFEEFVLILKVNITNI